MPEDNGNPQEKDVSAPDNYTTFINKCLESPAVRRAWRNFNDPADADYQNFAPVRNALSQELVISPIIDTATVKYRTMTQRWISGIGSDATIFLELMRIFGAAMGGTTSPTPGSNIAM